MTPVILVMMVDTCFILLLVTVATAVTEIFKHMSSQLFPLSLSLFRVCGRQLSQCNNKSQLETGLCHGMKRETVGGLKLVDTPFVCKGQLASFEG